MTRLLGPPRRRGFTLVEVLILGFTVSMGAIVVTSLAWQASTADSVAGEERVACLVARSQIDRVRLDGYPLLQARAGAPAAGLEISEEVDGVVYRGTVRVEPVADALLRISVQLQWNVEGGSRTPRVRKLEAIRLVADPAAALGALSTEGDRP